MRHSPPGCRMSAAGRLRARASARSSVAALRSGSLASAFGPGIAHALARAALPLDSAHQPYRDVLRCALRCPKVEDGTSCNTNLNVKNLNVRLANGTWELLPGWTVICGTCFAYTMLGAKELLEQAVPAPFVAAKPKNKKRQAQVRFAPHPELA